MTDSETQRLRINDRLARLEERVEQFKSIFASNAQLRRDMNELKIFKTRMETRESDTDKRSQKALAWIGAAIAASTLLIQVLFKIFG